MANLTINQIKAAVTGAPRSTKDGKTYYATGAPLSAERDSGRGRGGISSRTLLIGAAVGLLAWKLLGKGSGKRRSRRRSRRRR